MHYTRFQEAIPAYRTPITERPVGGENNFVNRELSWMEFNERVLEEARDKDNPLFERLNFLAITCSNLDEFFMIRVASTYDMRNAGQTKKDPAGYTPADQLEALMARIRQFYKRQYSTYNRLIIPALEKESIRIVESDQLTEDDREYIRKYFRQTVYLVITPMAVDAGRPFPHIANQTLNLYVGLETENDQNVFKPSGGIGDYKPFAIVPIPSVLPRLIELPGEPGRLILLETIIRENLEELFSNMQIGEVVCFRAMRNADFEIDEDDVPDLMLEIEDKLKLRERGEIIRLEVDKAASKQTLNLLKDFLEVEDTAILKIKGPIDLKFVSAIKKFYDRPDLEYTPFTGQPSPKFTDENYFAAIRQGDVILHHPYESFEPVVEIIRRAANDPKVLAIKQTLYRVSGQSPIIASLAEAAEAGKQVMVLVELKARFDEENNIHWAKRLEKAGCHVIYGLKGLKTHSKITLIVREESNGIRRYVHLGTGNYNDATAKIYTDLGMWTCKESYGSDATDFFNMISGYSLPLGWNKLIPAPRWLRKETLYRIRQETEHALEGRKAVIVAKMNSLVDPEVIDALYEASQAGVTVRLIVRGICCLRPGVKGLSENIEVRSIVGRFLEHSRIFYYYNDGNDDLFLSSADWMPRNLNRRIELLFPVEDEYCRERVFEILAVELRDNLRARLILGDGTFTRLKPEAGETPLDSQVALCESAIKAYRERRKTSDNPDRYIPQTAKDVERG